MMAILVCGKASGAHVNPQVSVAFAVSGRLPLTSLPAYFIAQFVGAGAGAGIVLQIYRDSISTEALMAMATYPSAGRSLFSLLFDQVISCFLLTLVIVAVAEQGQTAGGLVVGITVTGIGAALGPVAGAALNPAADFMPRFAAYIAGDMGAFSRGHNFWLLPFFLPYIGGALASLTYKYGIASGGEEHEGTRQKDEESLQTKL